MPAIVLRDNLGRIAKGNPTPTRENHPSWKGGKVIDGRGYVLVRHDHPNHRHRYIREHRLIMEKYIGRYLRPEEVIHHKNGNLRDNRIENLELFNGQEDHIKIEASLGKYKNTHINQLRDKFGRFCYAS